VKGNLVAYNEYRETTAQLSRPLTNPGMLFGDLLALARRRWVAAMAEGVAELGFADYRRSDALLMRLLLGRGPLPLSAIASMLGVTRQAARKAVDHLERRGYASEARDAGDSRIVNVSLTAEGERYARAVIAVLRRLNDELAASVDANDLAAARRVLRAIVED